MFLYLNMCDPPPIADWWRGPIVHCLHLKPQLRFSLPDRQAWVVNGPATNHQWGRRVVHGGNSKVKEADMPCTSGTNSSDPYGCS